MTQQPHFVTQFTKDTDLMFESSDLLAEPIALEASHFDQAAQISDRVTTEKRQWQTYLNALALLGLKQWFTEYATDLSFDPTSGSIWQPQYANAISAIFNLQVGDFKLGLIAMGNLTKPVIKLPRAIVDLPEFATHFYIVMKVLDEQEQAQVWGVLRYDELINNLKTHALPANPDWTYSIPTSWFDRNTEHLLLYLRCLEPKAIALPMQPDRLPVLSQMREELAQLLPKLRSADTELWDVLDWEQGVAVLTCPQLLDWVYQIQTQAAIALNQRLTEILQRLTQPIINVGLWVQGEIDELTQKLSWQLLPSFALMQSTVEDIGTVLTQLRRTGLVIPPHARGGYRDLSDLFKSVNTPLGLHAITWSLAASDEMNPEWSLLLILGTQANQPLPANTTLRVSDETTVLLEQKLPPLSTDSYLYTRVAGTWNEKFLATIVVNHISITLPPFAFQPNQPL